MVPGRTAIKLQSITYSPYSTPWQSPPVLFPRGSYGQFREHGDVKIQNSFAFMVSLMLEAPNGIDTGNADPLVDFD